MIRDSQVFQPFTEEPISLIDEAGRWTAPFELDLDDDRPAHDQPEIPQEEAHSHEYEANQWVWCGSYRSRFAVGAVAGFDG